MQGKNVETNKAEISSIPQVSFSALLWVFFAASIQFLGDFIHFLYRNSVLIVIFLVAGLALGYISYVPAGPSYHVSMIVKSEASGTAAFEEMVENIGRLISGGTAKEVANRLHTSPEISKSLVSVNSRALQNDGINEDIEIGGGSRFFAIEIELNDIQKADTLQNLVLDYFNKNPYLSRFHEEKTRSYERRLSILDAEIKTMNGLKETYPYAKMGESLRRGNDKLPGLAAIGLRLSDAHNEKEKIMEWLRLSPATVVKIDAVTTPISDEKRLLKRMIAFGIASFIVGCFIAASVVVIRKQRR